MEGQGRLWTPPVEVLHLAWFARPGGAAYVHRSMRREGEAEWEIYRALLPRPDAVEAVYTEISLNVVQG